MIHALLLVLSLSAAEPQWEYTYLVTSSILPETRDEIQMKLNELKGMGSNGWELVAVAPANSDNSVHILYFKRKVPVYK